MKQQKQNRHLELTRKVTVLQTIPKQRNIQKAYKRRLHETTKTEQTPKTHEESNSTSENSKTTPHPKNTREACEGSQLSVIIFIEETMETLATYRKQMKSHLDINLIQTEI